MHTDTTLDTKDSKAAQIRYVFDLLGTPTTAQVIEWLDAHGVSASPRYVRGIVRKERARRGLTDTADLPALTREVLAELVQDRKDATKRPAEPGSAGTEGTARTESTEPEPAGELPEETSAPAVDEATADLAARVANAHARLPLQADPALYTALSDEEMDKERTLAEEEREGERVIRRRRLAAQLAVAKRDQATAEAVSKAEASDARWLQRARSKKRRLTSDDAKLAQLTRNSEWSARALVAAVVLGMAWSAANAQHNLVPSGNKADPLFWLSYGVEAMISLPLIVIMVASTTATRWGRSMAPEQKKKVIAVELALLTTTLALNVGPHLFPPEGQPVDKVEVFKFGVAPVMVGVLLQVHAWASDHYATLILNSARNDDQEG